MEILVFNAGDYSGSEGGAVRFKNLVVQSSSNKVHWIDPAYSRSTFHSKATETSAPLDDVDLIKGFEPSFNPLIELGQREKHFLNAVRHVECDVAVFFNPWGTFLARRWLKKSGVPVVFDYIDLMHAFRRGIQRSVGRWSVKQALKQADLVITTAQILFEDAKQHNRNIRLIPNGVNLDYFKQANPKQIEHPSVGFVGALGDWVDVESVLESAINSNACFYFVGDGPKRRLIDKAALPNVMVTGFAPHTEVRDWVSSFDICLVPFVKNELTEAVCPIKMFEYWALGKPVIATPTREIKRIAGDAVLYASSVEDWRAHINAVIENESMALELGEKGRRIVKGFDWRKLSTEYLQALEEVSTR